MATPAHFNRLSISVRDFEQAVEFAERAAATPRDDLAHRALLLSAIISYYRPFSPNERIPTTKATASLNIADFGSLTSDEVKLHERLKTLRNKVLAHSEYDMNPTSLDEHSGVVSSRPYDLLAESIDPQSLVALVKKLANTCHHWRADHIFHPAGGKSAA